MISKPRGRCYYLDRMKRAGKKTINGVTGNASSGHPYSCRYYLKRAKHAGKNLNGVTKKCEFGTSI